MNSYKVLNQHSDTFGAYFIDADRYESSDDGRLHARFFVGDAVIANVRDIVSIEIIPDP